MQAQKQAICHNDRLIEKATDTTERDPSFCYAKNKQRQALTGLKRKNDNHDKQNEQSSKNVPCPKRVEKKEAQE